MLGLRHKGREDVPITKFDGFLGAPPQIHVGDDLLGRGE